jgi:hypothetical protein
MRRTIYIICGAAVLFSSFFITLWLTEPEAPPERLEDQRISNYSDLSNAAQNVGLRLSVQMQGVVDAISRINEREVKIVGWLADPQGNSTPLELFVFMDGSMVAAAQTKGERPDVANAINLSHGAEKNIAYSLTFKCRPGGRPVFVGVEGRKQYIALESKECP